MRTQTASFHPVRVLLGWVAATALWLWHLPAIAAPLVIGLAAQVTSVDPHYQLIAPNKNVAEHIYDRLVHRDASLAMVPGLAQSWRLMNETTWEFILRGNVKFHNGAPFSAEDVKFSIERVPTIKGSPNPFTTYTSAIAGVDVVDKLVVRIRTHRPHPLIPQDLSVIPIVSRAAALNATTADFDSGKAAIGTGPYKFGAFVRGDRVELVRNPLYWGKAPSWDAVVFRMIPSTGDRMLALQSGSVQAIEGVSVADMPALKKDPNLRTAVRFGYRLMHLSLNQNDAVKAIFTDKDGNALPTNPLRSLKVRQALTKAIARDVLLARVLNGAATLTGQLMNSGLPGFVGDIAPPDFDPEGARRLLAEAGYPDGFRMTIHGPANRYHMDTELLQAIAQMFTRVGVVTRAESMPTSVFFPRRNKGDFAVALTGWSPDSLEGSSMLRPLLATRNAAKGMGEYNLGYSNPAVDELIEKMMTTMQDPEREKLMAAATRLAMGDAALIPLHHQCVIWAMRKEVSYTGRADERTYAFDFLPNP